MLPLLLFTVEGNHGYFNSLVYPVAVHRSRCSISRYGSRVHTVSLRKHVFQ